MIPTTGPRAPYQGAPTYHPAPNAALLIDFDNVTMGIRSDLGKELKSLLNSDVIRGKVAVQRAYADWRRYPQYIVPLAESSIDLIFAPAYGSSKKNATDLRMAIDAIELVFTRPEIGTFILMTGDSDFSSCVLKLKEYGKYVIGVGMRQSSSDLLIQNCDEYYSYHSLSGLTRTGETEESKEDPWTLVRRAAVRMESAGDVMRTDRLKQVMLDLDPAFDEKKVGYNKFSRFVQDAANKGILSLRRGENGQFEIMTDGDEQASPAEPEAAPRRGRGRGEARREPRAPRPAPIVATPAPEAAVPAASETVVPEAAAIEAEEARPTREPQVAAKPREQAARQDDAPAVADALGLAESYGLLQEAVRQLSAGAGKAVRDGDVKREMLRLVPDFDEATLGFSKFTRFLRQAHDAEIIDLNRANGGNYEVSLSANGKRLPAPVRTATTAAESAPGAPAVTRTASDAAPKAMPPTVQPTVPAEAPAVAAEPARVAAAEVPVRATRGALRGRRGGRTGVDEGPPPILPGQAVQAVKPVIETAPEAPQEEAAAKPKTRRGRRGRGKSTAGPSTLENEVTEIANPAPPPEPEVEPEAKPVVKRSRSGAARVRKPAVAAEAVVPEPSFSAETLGLPRDRAAIESYLSNSYHGVGKKTAEQLLDTFGPDVFRMLKEEPARISDLLGSRRAGTLLEQWDADYARRATSAEPAPEPVEPSTEEERPQSRSRRGGRGRTRKPKEPAPAS